MIPIVVALAVATPPPSPLPALLALCTDRQAELLARWTPGDAVGELATAPVPDLERLAREIPNARWFRFGGPPLPSPAFQRPVVRTEVRTPYPLVRWIDLGACEGYGQLAWLAATVPLEPIVPVEGGRLSERLRSLLEARAGAEVDSSMVRVIPGEPALREVVFVGPAVGAKAGTTSAVPKDVKGWALFGPRDELLAIELLRADAEDAEHPPEVAGEVATINVGSWSRLPGSPGARVGAVPFAHGSGAAGGDWFGFWVVHVDASARVRIERIGRDADAR